MNEIQEMLEQECAELLPYLYDIAGRKYRDGADTESLIQDTLLVYIRKRQAGESIEHPKAFTAAILRNRYFESIREKYRYQLVSFGEEELIGSETDDSWETDRERAGREQEYETIRREIGRLIRIYREVTVRHYVHGESIGQISGALQIPPGTVLSRLSYARKQIQEGMEKMEKYDAVSYEPKQVSLSIWGNPGLKGEPFSLVHSGIEANLLVLSYENPVSVRKLSDKMGMPSAYIEPLLDVLVQGELMGRTSGGLVYTRCFLQRYEDSFGDVAAQEALADARAEDVWGIISRHFEPLYEHEEFRIMSEKQKATMILFVMNQCLSGAIRRCCPKDAERTMDSPPIRPNGGRWLASGTVRNYGQKRDQMYDGSGPVSVGYSRHSDGKMDCQMFDCQSLFGDAHWAYSQFRYRLPLQTILRFYASLLPCDVRPDLEQAVYEMIPEFERLGMVKRGEDGECHLDIPALSYDEVVPFWNPAVRAAERDLAELLRDDLRTIWESRKNRVPKHVDGAASFVHEGALRAYPMAQHLSIVRKGLVPYPVVIGKTPLVYLSYRKTPASSEA